jgi:protein SSD1
MGQFSMNNAGLDGQGQNFPRGHGRRHSVNVVNKPGTGSISYGNPYVNDGYDDGFTPVVNGGHSRQASRADSSWRISK